jgi:hypothetical protein
MRPAPLGRALVRAGVRKADTHRSSRPDGNMATAIRAARSGRIDDGIVAARTLGCQLPAQLGMAYRRSINSCSSARS